MLVMPPSFSAHHYWPPYVVECRVGQLCDPGTRGELANDLGEHFASMWPKLLHSGPVTVEPGTGQLVYTGYAPTVTISPAIPEAQT